MLDGTEDVIAFNKDMIYIYLSKSEQVLTIGKRHKNMYYIDIHHAGVERIRANAAIFPVSKLTLLEWHVILGHTALKIIIATLKAARIEFDFRGQSLGCFISLLVKFRFLTTKPTGITVSPCLYITTLRICSNWHAKATIKPSIVRISSIDTQVTPGSSG